MKKHTAKQPTIQPIANIVRKYATKSFPVGMISCSEGYEITRTCFGDRVTVAYQPCFASNGKSGYTPESVANGIAAIANIVADLRAHGFVVEPTDSDLEVTVYFREQDAA